MTKIILNNPEAPDIYTDYINKNGIKSRFDEDVIAFLATAEEVGLEIENKDRDFFLENKDKLFSVAAINSDTYFGWCTHTNRVGYIKVMKYDETHRHAIDEYNGYESLVDLDAYKCIDKEHNIWLPIL